MTVKADWLPEFTDYVPFNAPDAIKWNGQVYLLESETDASVLYVAATPAADYEYVEVSL